MDSRNFDLLEFFSKLTDQEIVTFVYSKVFNLPLKKIISYRNLPSESIYDNLNKIREVLHELGDHNEMVAIIQAMFERDDLLLTDE